MFHEAAAIQHRLQALDIASVIIGGLAVAIWGEPRLTRDIDLKIALDRDETHRLLGALPPEWRPLSEDPARTFDDFGVLFLQTAEGLRFDLLLGENAFDRQSIERGQAVEIEPGLQVVVCSPEDLLIYKLVSMRPRDHEDARTVALRQADTLDDRYILDWLTLFEQALDDSTLIDAYRQLRRRPGRLL